MSGPGVVVVIPARYESSRFPGKALAMIGEKPLIWWVWEGATGSRGVDRVLIATDDERIARTVRAFGGETVLTAPFRRSGSDRVAEVITRLGGLKTDIIVNLQGDEILRSPTMLAEAVEPCLADPRLTMSTLKQEITTWAELTDPNVVKVVTDAEGSALYFSRAPIPHTPTDGSGPFPAKTFYKHLGVYVFRRSLLMEFAEWPTAPLEAIERLEQLRALAHGVRMRVVETGGETIRVDTPADLERARVLLMARLGTMS